MSLYLETNVTGVIECTEYKLLPAVESSSARVWDKVSGISCDGDLHGWYRFNTEIASFCEFNPIKNSTTLFVQPCGATFRGWMPDRHPTMMEGRVERKICFSYDGKCQCEFMTNIAVRNCGDYFVYRLRGVPICKAKYCSAPEGLTSKGMYEMKYFQIVVILS